MYRYRFSWDPHKAASNWNKHGVRFELAATMFRDPLAVSVYDSDRAKAIRRVICNLSTISHVASAASSTETKQISICQSIWTIRWGLSGGTSKRKWRGAKRVGQRPSQAGYRPDRGRQV